MIISASRRTDIPAYYCEWFMNRIRAGFCIVPNPFNRAQISRVSLAPDEVDGIVFWTRNPRPMLHYLQELDDRGYRYYFLYTLMANPRVIDPGAPPLEKSIDTFRELASRIGAQRVVWRYDPIFLTAVTDPEHHARAYAHIAGALSGCTEKSVISVVHMYRKIQGRVRGLSDRGIRVLAPDEELLSPLLRSLAHTASENGMEIRSCANDLLAYGINPGKCIDERILSLSGPEIEVGKDACQREHCRCSASKDIGMYESCPSGCIYCYATTSFERAREDYRTHDPGSPSLL